MESIIVNLEDDVQQSIHGLVNKSEKQLYVEEETRVFAMWSSEKKSLMVVDRD
jgi:hypothetical protein